MNPSPERHKSEDPVSSSPIRNVFLEDPFVASNDALQRQQQMTAMIQGIDVAAAEISQKIANARSLTHYGYRGTFDIGRFVCLIDPYTGEPIPIAEMKPDAEGNMVVYDCYLNKDVRDILPSCTGTAEWGKKGEFKGFKETGAAAWVFGPG